jgi:prepilin peptidase CpaA
MPSYYIVALLTGLIVLSVAVSISDFKFRRIPNKYLLWGLVYAVLVFVAMTFTMPIKDVGKGFLFSFMGFLLGGVFLLPSYLLKQVAAGDVKLMMVFGFYLGPKGIIFALLNGALIGGIWALVLAWQLGGLGHMLYNLKFMARSAYLTGFKEMGWDLRSEKAIKMPYGVALSIGAILVAIWQLYIHIGRLLGVPA